MWKVTLPEHPSEPDSLSSRLAKNLLGFFRRLMNRFGRSIEKLFRTAFLALKKLKRTVFRVVRFSAKGIFPPIGVLSILVLTVLSAGIPNWGSNIHDSPYYIILGSVFAFGYLLWRIPRARYSAIFASIFGWLPVTLGALTYPYWYWYANWVNTPPEADFFHAAAEVLPVLLLATVVDVRRTKDLESKQLVLPIAAVFLGEVAALNALAFGNAGPADFAAVASSFVTSIVALVLAVMADIAPSADNADETAKSPAYSAQIEADMKDPSPSNPPSSTAQPPVPSGPITASTEGSSHALEQTHSSDLRN
jgi:hypothetical protein